MGFISDPWLITLAFLTPLAMFIFGLALIIATERCGDSVIECLKRWWLEVRKRKVVYTQTYYR